MMIASKRFWVLSVVVALAVLGPVAAIACGLFRDAPLPESVAAEGQEAKTEAPPVRASVDAKETEEAGWSTVTGRIVFGGANLPAPIAVKMGANGAGCLPAGGQIFGEEWVVDQKTKGVRWVFVWLSPVGGANNPLPIHPSLTEITVKEAVIDQPCCQFVPHALALRQGQDLIVKNSSAIVHNANVSGHPLRNPGKNFAIPAGMSGKLDGLKADEKVAISVACDIHPWMKGYVRVFDHPYFAVTDAEGRFVIPKAPAGNCRLRVWHDSGWLGGAAGKDGQLLMVENGKPTEVGELRLGP